MSRITFRTLDVISNSLLLILGELKMHFLEEIKRWLGEITEIILLLIAVVIDAGIHFGAQVPFFSGVVANLTTLISSLGENGMVGLIALAIIFYLFRRRATV